MATNRTTLFLYGSLKRGYCNHARIAEQEFRGEAATTPHYRIIELGQYGGLIRDDAHGLAVKGEIWSVSPACLADLDAFELDEGLWIRRPVEVPGYDSVEAYLWAGEVSEQARSGDEWPLPGTRSEA